MGDATVLAQVSVGILTWNRPSTLRYALKSYRKAGLLDAVGEVILFANASHPKEMTLARDYRLRLLASEGNIGIGPAFARLAQAAEQPLFLFLENDWPCIEPGPVARARLAQGVRLLVDGTADAIRFRHRKKYGHPLYSRARCDGHELDPRNRAHILDAAYWCERPDAKFPDHITRRSFGSEAWFFAAAQNAAYTNNPGLYRTDFARDQIGPRGDVPGLASEAHLQDWWRQQPLTVAMGEGLFTHRDPGKEWRRARSIVAKWLGLAR